MEIHAVLLDPELPPPTRTYGGDVGIDLRARTDVTLTSLTAPACVPTGLAVEIPEGYVGLVCSRSGLARDRGIAVLNGPGVIDPGYRGELMVVLFSTRETAHTLRRGDRIAQLLIIPAAHGHLVFVDELEKTERGSSGLGSSGA
jgi:dUTP pyrophosphatase